MSDPIPPNGLVVTPNGFDVQAKAQLRLLVAAICGAIVTAAANRLNIPLLSTVWGAQGEQIVGIITGGIIFGAVAVWQWARVRLVNARWWHLAVNPRVPADLVRPATQEPSA